jgi:hypothetical protein
MNLETFLKAQQLRAKITDLIDYEEGLIRVIEEASIGTSVKTLSREIKDAATEHALKLCRAKLEEYKLEFDKL